MSTELQFTAHVADQQEKDILAYMQIVGKYVAVQFDSLVCVHKLLPSWDGAGLFLLSLTVLVNEGSIEMDQRGYFYLVAE